MVVAVFIRIIVQTMSIWQDGIVQISPKFIANIFVSEIGFDVY
jgi:hypothetical protein